MASAVVNVVAISPLGPRFVYRVSAVVIRSRGGRPAMQKSRVRTLVIITGTRVSGTRGIAIYGGALAGVVIHGSTIFEEYESPLPPATPRRGPDSRSVPWLGRRLAMT